MASSVMLALLMIFTVFSQSCSTSTQWQFSFLENTGANYFVGRITITGSSDFNFTDPTGLCQKYFTLMSNGEIQTDVDIDREAVVNATHDHSDQIECPVKYRSENNNMQTVVVQITVEDINDQTPRFFGLASPVHQLNVYENVAVGQPLVYLAPDDQDEGPNGTVQFHITGGNVLGLFRLDLAIGDDSQSPERILYLAQPLDHENRSSYNLSLTLSDMGSPPLTAIQYIVIKVVDVDDQSPMFPASEITFDVPENHPLGSMQPFGNVSAIDSDSDANNIVFYYFDETGIVENADQYFGVTSVTGELYLLKRLDYEMSPAIRTYTFGVIARSQSSLQGATVTVTVHVKDANDESPQYVLEEHLVQNITENQDNSTILLIVRDRDISSTDNRISSIQLQLEPNVAHSEPTNELVVPNSGISRLKFNITQPLDREKTPVILATFILTDSGTPSLTSVINVTINVEDINDNAPQFNQSSSVSISEATAIGKEVLQLSAEDDDNEKNGTIRYSIVKVTPSEATAWFTLDEVSGLLTLSATPDYDVAANVLIEVRAADLGSPPLSNMTLVNISISPPITFPPRSFQQYNGYDLFQDPIIYMEFRTGSMNALLLYQTTENGDEFRALQIINGSIVYSSSAESTSTDTMIQVDKWYSLLIDETKHIQFWDSNSQTTELLRTANFQGCEGSQPTATDGSSLSVGGLENAFTVPPNRIDSHDLIGAIRTVIINNKQLDLRCPDSSRGTLKGFFYSSVCPRQCSSDRVSCVQYTVTPECQCKGGFDQTVCKSDSDYGSISVSNGSALEFSLGYNFFFDTRFQSASAPGQDRSHVLQTVNVSFTPASTNLSGLIFYSRTDATIQVMEVEETIRYSIYNTDYTPKVLLVSQTEFNFKVGQEYRFTIEITNTTANMYQFNEPDQQRTKLDSKPTLSLSLYTQTSAVLSLGGTEDRKAKFVVGDFEGCINNVELNGVSVPLKGVLSSTDRTIIGSPEGLGSTCHPCYSGACPANSTCEIQGSISENDHQCICNNPGYTITNGACGPPNRVTTPSPTLGPTGGAGPSGEQLHLGLLAGIAVSALLLIAFVSILILAICRVGYTYKRRAVAEFTPSSNSTPPQPQRQQEKCNGIGKSDSEMVSALKTSMSKHSNDYVTHTLMTSNLPAIQLTNDNLSPCSPSSARSRSVSQETGFQTASELGDSRRNSHREDLPLDSDFSTYDTDSEDFTGTSGIEEVMSPHDLHLVSSGSRMGVPHDFRRKHPLTPKERNVLMPLRPNSDLLSETDTELSIGRQPARSFVDNASQATDSTTHKWYKSSSPSTIVDEDANVPHSLQAVALHKQHRSKKKHSVPSHFKHGMTSSPIYHYPYHPQTSSPLVHSQRFNFPAVSPLEPPHLTAITEHMMPSYGYPYHTMHPACHPRQYSEHSYTEAAAAPIHIRGISDSAYYPGYQGTSLSSTGHPETPHYRDLNSFAQGVNPITYWEQQTRLRPTVDQEDPLHLLAGPCVPFEDVSTEPSVIESTVVDNHSSIIYMPSAQGAAEQSTRLSASQNKAWTPPVHNGTPSYHMEPYRDSTSGVEDPALDNNMATNLDSTGSTQSQSRPQLTRVNITHFPTAECTPSYNNHSSNTLMSPSGASGFQVSSLQDPLCV